MFIVSVGAETMDEIQIYEVKRPPKDFLQYGEVIGINQILLDQLGLESGDPLEVITPTGKSVGMRTKDFRDHLDTIYARGSVRESLGIEDGKIKLTLKPIKWSEGPAVTEEIQFSKVRKPPKAFLQFGPGAGVSLSVFKKLNIQPGQAAVLIGPSNKKSLVYLQVLDRGENVISIKKSIREALGIEAGNVELKLKVIQKSK